MSSSREERSAFSARLQQALCQLDYSPESPTALAREFNIRFAGKPITVHAARKWLVGEAIPTQEKLRTLAGWLGVPSNWLRFGGHFDLNASLGRGCDNKKIMPRDVAFLENLGRLREEYRELVRQFVQMLMKAVPPSAPAAAQQE